MTKRELAKDVAFGATSVAVTSASNHALEATTDIDTDATSVSVGTTVVGIVVAWKLKPLTDRGVDRVANTFSAIRTARREKKLSKQETE